MRVLVILCLFMPLHIKANYNNLFSKNESSHKAPLTLKPNHGYTIIESEFSFEPKNLRKLVGSLIGISEENLKNCITMLELEKTSEMAEALFYGELEIECTPDKNSTAYYIKKLSTQLGNEEAQNLIILESNLKTLIPKLPNKLFINIPLGIFLYQNEMSQFQIITIAKAADGIELSEIFKKYYEELRFDEAFSLVKKLGRIISSLHMTFMDKTKIPSNFLPTFIDDASNGSIYPTINHGDSHFGNIFYDFKSDVFTYIDAEGFGRSLKAPSSIFLDLIKATLYSSSKFFACNNSNYDKNKCNFGTNLGYLFLKEYIANYDNHSAILKNYILEIFSLFIKKGIFDLAPYAQEIWLQALKSL